MSQEVTSESIFDVIRNLGQEENSVIIETYVKRSKVSLVDGKLIIQILPTFAEEVKRLILKNTEVIKAKIGAESLYIETVEKEEGQQLPLELTKSLPKRNEGTHKKWETLKNFVVDDESNLVPYGIIRGLLDEKIHLLSRVIVIYGPTGSGKTHLLEGLRLCLNSNGGETSVSLVTVDDFFEKMVAAIKNETTPAFKKGFSSLNWLLMEGIQSLQGKNKTQEKLAEIIDAITKDGGTVVMTADRNPSKIKISNPGLKSRLESFSVPIDVPCESKRLEIIRCWLEHAEIKLNPDELGSLSVLAKEIVDIRKLLAMTTAVLARNSITRRPICPELVEEVIGNREILVSPREIIESVSGMFGQTVESVIGRGKSKKFLEPRQVAIFLITKHCPELSLEGVGNFFGGRDHSTISNSRNRIASRLKLKGLDSKIGYVISEAERRLKLC